MARRRPSGLSPLAEFFVRSGRLKSELRRGWVKKLLLEHPESVADHSYRTALITMVLSDAAGLDTEKAVRMALLHDLPESVVGDAMPEERSGPSKLELETGAMEKLLSSIPPPLRSLYSKSWREFSAGRSRESRLVRQVDKLEMAIQAWEYVGAGAADPKKAREFMATARAHVADGELVKLLGEFEF